MNIRVFSYGGSGFKFFSKFVNPYVQVRYDDKKIHPYIHHNRPKNKFLGLDKIIFLYGDPRNALLSHIGKCEKKDIQFSTRRFRQLADPFEIKEYIKEDWISEKDFFVTYPDYLDFLGFFNAWFNFKFKKDSMLFIKYENLKENINKITSFLGLGSSFRNNFIENLVSSRRSRFDTNPNRGILSKNYNKLIAIQDKLPSFLIK